MNKSVDEYARELVRTRLLVNDANVEIILNDELYRLLDGSGASWSDALAVRGRAVALLTELGDHLEVLEDCHGTAGPHLAGEF